MCKVIIGLGQYRICGEYKHFEVSPSRWFTALSEKKFQQASLDDKHSTNNTDNGMSETAVEGIAGLSVDIQTTATVTGLPLLTVRQIWAKASELTLCHGQVLCLHQDHHLRVAWLPVKRRKSHTLYPTLLMVDSNVMKVVKFLSSGTFVLTLWLLLKTTRC